MEQVWAPPRSLQTQGHTPTHSLQTLDHTGPALITIITEKIKTRKASVLPDLGRQQDSLRIPDHMVAPGRSFR